MNQTLVVPREMIHDTEDNNTKRWIFVGECVYTSCFCKGAVFLFFAMYSHDFNNTTTTKKGQPNKKPTINFLRYQCSCKNSHILVLWELVDINYYWWK